MFWLFQSINKESPEISFGSLRSVRMFSIWSFLQQPTVLVEARNLAWPWSGESRKAGADTNFHLFRKRSPVSPRNSPVDWAKKPFLIYIPTGISIKLCFPEGKYRENKSFQFPYICILGRLFPIFMDHTTVMISVFWSEDVYGSPLFSVLFPVVCQARQRD